MSHFASLVSLHLAGEEPNPPADDVTLDTLPGKFTLTRTDDALTAYGGLVAWSGFERCTGINQEDSGWDGAGTRLDGPAAGRVWRS